MSALGQEQTFALHQPMSALPPIADITQRHSMRRGHPSVAPQTHCLLFFFFWVSWFLLFLLIAPVLTSIAPICASSTHG